MAVGRVVLAFSTASASALFSMTGLVDPEVARWLFVVAVVSAGLGALMVYRARNRHVSGQPVMTTGNRPDVDIRELYGSGFSGPTFGDDAKVRGERWEFDDGRHDGTATEDASTEAPAPPRNDDATERVEVEPG